MINVHETGDHVSLAPVLIPTRMIYAKGNWDDSKDKSREDKLDQNNHLHLAEYIHLENIFLPFTTHAHVHI